MLKTLQNLLVALQPPPPGAAAADEEHLLQLATVVMLDKFALGEDEAARLAELARTTAHAATDLYAFTSRINERFEMAQKLKMIEHMWRVAYADGHLSAHERHVMWRIADLLHVPQGAYHHARLRAQPAAHG
jgi:uncharacterized tellurite resistance protein B-like protein